ncbi:MAG: PKD domain-containing protein, partial [Promethearchaeota archaeon]
TIQLGSDTTDSKGRWGIAAAANWVPFAMVEIRIAKTGYVTESIPDVLWWVALVTKHDVTLLPNSWSCSGYVTATAGAPLEGATVEVLNGNSEVMASTKTNSNGYYYLSVSNPNAQPGTIFTVQVSKTHFSTTSVTKPKGGSYTQDFQPACTGRYWYGVVQDHSNQPVDGVLVQVFSTLSGVRIGYDTTDSKGRWGIAAGGYLLSSVWIRLSKSNYVTETLSNVHWMWDVTQHDVTITNVNAGSDQTVNEGDEVRFSGSIDDPQINSYTITWDFGDGSTTTGTLTPTHTYVDNGTYIVTLTVTDTGGSGVDSLTITVNNVAPTADLRNDGPKNEGSIVTVWFTEQFDPGSADTFTYSFDWNDDGNYEIIDQTDSFATHIWEDNGTYWVRGRIEDNDGGYSVYWTQVTVNNVAPTARFRNDSPEKEGSLVTIWFTEQADPGSADTWTYSFDWNNDGIYEIIDQDEESATHTWDDNGDYWVRGRIKDNDGGYTVYGTLVRIYNARPTASFHNDGPKDEGHVVTVWFANQNDPGTADTLMYSFDWNNDGIYEIIDQDEESATHTWDDEGSYQVRGRIKDDDGGYSIYWTIVTVDNIAPTASFHNNGPKDEGHVVTVWFADQNDPGTTDILTYSFDWNNDGIYEIVDQYDASATHIWDDDGEYKVRGRISDDDGGYTEYITEVFILDLDPTAAFTWYPEPQDEASLVIFTDISTSPHDMIVDWDWKFGDGATSTNQHPTHQYMDNGIYTVTLTVTDDDGSSDSISHSVTILDLGPTAAFTWNPDPQNEGAMIQFTDASTSFPDTIVVWYWDFGDGMGISTIQDPAYTYMDDGMYSVTLTVTDDDGSTDIVSHMVTILDLSPTAALTCLPEPVNEGSPLTFTDLSTSYPDAIVDWEWDFGDGTGTSTDQHPIYTYMDDGVYSVTLTVTDDDGSVDTVSRMVTITDLEPTAAFTWSPEPQVEGTKVEFTDISTSFPDTIVDWYWDFDDGMGTSTMQDPAYTYMDDRVYSVTLTVTDDDGSTDAISHMVTILDLSPTADFTCLPEPVNEGSPLIFTDLSTSYPDAIVDWEWDFGDGSTNEAQHPTHTYVDDGVYTVTLIVTDDDGSTNSISHLVTVLDLSPTADFTCLPEPVNEGTPLTFTDLSTSYPDAIIGWEWDFGDGIGSSTAQNPMYTYGDNGLYTVSLIIIDDDGSTATYTATITVYNVAPIVCIEAITQLQEFALEDLTIIMLDTVYFNGSGTDPGSDDLTFIWDWGDNTPQLINNYPNNFPSVYPIEIKETVSHNYAEPGVYIVTLTVKDDDNDIGKDTVAITVLGPRDLKENVIFELETIKTGDKHVDKKINSIIVYIKLSLSEKLWVDTTHLDPKYGALVFQYELWAEIHLQIRHKLCTYFIPILEHQINRLKAKGCDTTCLELKLARMYAALPVLESTIFKLVKADELIVRVAFADAESTTVQNPKWQTKVDHMLMKTREFMTKAAEKVEEEHFATAICHYKVAWKFSQQAIKWATKGCHC